jgi:hypothetical protein
MFGGNLKYGNKYQEDIYRSTQTRRQTIQRHLVRSGLFSSVSFGLIKSDYLAEFFVERNLEFDIDFFTDKHDLPMRPDIKIKGVKLYCAFRNNSNDLIFEKEYIGTNVGGIGVIIPSYVLSASRFIQMQLIFDTLVDQCIQDFAIAYKNYRNTSEKLLR